MKIAFALLLVAVTILLRLLHREVWRLPVHELKRRATGRDAVARALYRVRAYGYETSLLLGLLTALAAGGALTLVVLVRAEVWPLAFALCSVLLIVWYGWLPASRLRLPPALITKGSAVLERLLRLCSPLLRPLARWVQKRYDLGQATGIYEKADLLDLLERQKDQADNRVLLDELDIARNGLIFGDKLIRDHMTPRRVVRAVSAADEVGPILLDELHKSGHSRFPVYDPKAPEKVIGMLYLRDLMHVRGSLHVSDKLRPAVYYVQEDQGLDHALQAFLRTKHHLFVVVNKFAEITGIISIEDVLEQIVGREIVDEFDQFENLRAVAAVQAKKERQSQHRIPDAK